MNREFVGHQGTTDVITFNYLENGSLVPGDVAIEIAVGVEVAQREGEERPDSSYAQEMVLYIVHGLLHCAGEDDLDEKSAGRMRRREQEVISELEKEFDFNEIFPQGGN